MAAKRLKFWGWGYEDRTLSEKDATAIANRLGKLTGLTPGDYRAPPTLDEITLPPPRLEAPSSLSAIVRTDTYERAAHTYGKSYPDYIRAFDRDFDCAPDAVAYPESEDDIRRLLDWANDADAAASGRSRNRNDRVVAVNGVEDDRINGGQESFSAAASLAYCGERRSRPKPA